MANYTRITNCVNPQLSFITDIPVGDDQFGAINLTEVPSEQIVGLCVTDFRYDDLDNDYPGGNFGVVYPGPFFATSPGIYNGKPYYTFSITEDTHNVPGLILTFYISWNSSTSVWELSDNFNENTGPYCTKCCDGEYAYFKLDSESPLSDSGMGVVWEYTIEAPICYVKSISTEEYCTEQQFTGDFVNCWQTSTVDVVDPTVFEVELTTTFDSCEACVNPPTAMATNCETGQIMLIEHDEEFEYVDGEVVKFQEFAGCWELESFATDVATTVTILSKHDDCADCLPPHVDIECDPTELHKLVDCSGKLEDIYVKEDMTEFVNKIVKSEYYDTCFIVHPAEVPEEEVDFRTFFTVDEVHTNCYECLLKVPFEPNYEEECCDSDVVEKVLCDFGDSVYKEIASKKYGIKVQGKFEHLTSLMRFEAMKQQLRCTPHPPKPAPRVTECCLRIKQDCHQAQNNCYSCIEHRDECECVIHSDHQFPCKTYVVTITEETLALATDNINTYLNGKVFFGYFSCGETESCTAMIKETGEHEYCVIGTPLLGYYNNGEFIELSTEEGIECLPEETKCCK